MKLLVISFLLLVSVSVSGGRSVSDPVVDIDGNKLRVGSKYYILPLRRGSGGGVTIGDKTKNGSCSTDVVQERLEVSKGIPVTFLPANGKRGVVRLSTDLNFKFSYGAKCSSSPIWQLGSYDEVKKQYFVQTGGKEGHPGVGNVGSWFKIEKNGNDYNIRFCPTVCKFCKVICRDVGIYFDNGVRRLALSDNPFVVFFKKV